MNGVRSQGLLALWVNKTVLAFQSVEDERTLFARPADFDALHRGQAALPYAQVWAGANVHGEAAWYRAHSARLPGEEAGAINGFGAMLTVGYAIFYMLVLFDQDARLRLQGDGALVLRELRGSRSQIVSWPPPLGIREVDLTGLPERLMLRSRLLREDAPGAGPSAS